MAKTDWSWDNHKYKSKEWVNGKWQYIYNTAKNTSNTVKSKVKEVSNNAKTVYDATKNTAKNLSNLGRTAIDKSKEEVVDQAKKVQNKVESEIDKIKKAKEDAQKIVEERENTIGAFPVALVFGLAILGLIAAKIIADKVAIVEASNEAAEKVKKLNDNISDQRNKARSDDAETKAKPATEEEKRNIQKRINPNYNPENTDGWSNNCYSCSFAYDMNRRGIECTAINDVDGASFDLISGCYQDAKTVDVAPEDPQKGFNEEEQKEFIQNMIDDYPDGAYGNICVTWTPPYGLIGGHSMVWEKQDGKIVIRDCQTNETYDSEAEVRKILSMTGAAYYFRTDNLEVSDQMYNYIAQK